MEGGKVTKWGEHKSYKMRREHFFFFFFFIFQNHWNLFCGSTKMGIFYRGKKHFTPGKKSGKWPLPNLKNIPLTPLVEGVVWGERWSCVLGDGIMLLYKISHSKTIYQIGLYMWRGGQDQGWASDGDRDRKSVSLTNIHTCTGSCHHKLSIKHSNHLGMAPI